MQQVYSQLSAWFLYNNITRSDGSISDKADNVKGGGGSVSY